MSVEVSGSIPMMEVRDYNMTVSLTCVSFLRVCFRRESYSLASMLSPLISGNSQLGTALGPTVAALFPIHLPDASVISVKCLGCDAQDALVQFWVPLKGSFKRDIEPYRAPREPNLWLQYGLNYIEIHNIV